MQSDLRGKYIHTLCPQPEGEVTVGAYGVVRIEEIEHSGQMAHVRWFHVHFEDGRIVEYNGALIECVIWKDAVE